LGSIRILGEYVNTNRRTFNDFAVTVPEWIERVCALRPPPTHTHEWVLVVVMSVHGGTLTPTG
jgi:hypothetical protein